MCGILGYIRPRQAVNVLLPALKRLEYRGCDSAGIVTANGKTLDIRKTKQWGSLPALKHSLKKTRLGAMLISHVTWRTT